MNIGTTEFASVLSNNAIPLASFITTCTFLNIIYSFNYFALIKGALENLVKPSPSKKSQPRGNFTNDKITVINK